MNTVKQKHFLAPEAQDKLRDLFRRVHKEYPFYRRIFEEHKLSPDDDPISVLDRFPVLDRAGYVELQKDIFARLKSGHFLTEYTSGTTGPKKIRFVTDRDEAAEEELCLRFFRQCGLRPSDRVLAIDIDSPEIYLFYSRALLRMGIHDFSYVNFTGSGEEALKPLLAFRPTVILSVPSVLARCISELGRASRPDAQGGRLKKVLYIAENMNAELRHALSEGIGLEVFSFYGSTEIGSMAGECQKHEGIHLFNDAVVPTLIDPMEDADFLSAQVAWTTLHFTDQPLIKYVNGDIVSIRKTLCSCGSNDPLMTRVGRIDDTFAIYGQKFRYQDFAQAIAKRTGRVEALKIVITSEGKCDKVVFQIPDYLTKDRHLISEAVQSVGDFTYFLDSGFVRTEVQSCPGHEIIKRKSVRVVDCRRGVVGGGEFTECSRLPSVKLDVSTE